jgi:hypothetical protein
MPIPIQKLHEAQQPLRERILAFLRAQPDQAFSPVEIFAHLQGYDKMTVEIMMIGTTGEQRARLLAPIIEILKSAVTDGILQSAPYQSDVYYGMRR